MNVQGKPIIGTFSLATTLLVGITGMTGIAIATPPVVPFTRLSAIQVAQIAQVGTMVLYVNGISGQDSPTAGKAEASPLKTITYALQQAQPGTTIQVSPGSYSAASGEVFPLILKPGIILRGDEATKGQTTTINGGGQVNTVSLARQNVTIFAMQDSAIRGLSITNPLSRGTGVWVESTNPTIANNTFANSQREGIFMTGMATPVIEDNLFFNNEGNGISVARDAAGVIRNNVIQETGFGIAIGGTATTLIDRNQIISNTDGLYINERAQPVLRGNTIKNNQRDGIIITMDGKPDIGIASQDGNNLVKDNGAMAVNNSGSQSISAIGNDLDIKKIFGNVIATIKEIPDPGGVIASSFKDVKGHWAEAYIAQLATRGVITGFPDATFKPEAPVTRAQFATIINKAFAPAPKRDAIVFGDVARKFWGFDQITAASRGGFMSGYPGNLFKPEQSIPRVQVLVALANGLQFREANVSILAIYKDSSAIPAYATGFVAAATQRRIVINYPFLTRLNPNREATRAEVAAIVYQALVNAGKANPIPSNYIVTP
ncbi:MAG: DUF1565 domain-containing protein [Alkalinema sp. CAN_BIN05]|nr:DUF1565 domain-containing protein [Alkalinema sp. CAN_BIN05]